MQYIIVLLISLLTLPTAWADNHEPKTKKVCVKQTDAKTKKEKEVCKTIKVHKKLEGTTIEGAKKDAKK